MVNVNSRIPLIQSVEVLHYTDTSGRFLRLQIKPLLKIVHNHCVSDKISTICAYLDISTGEKSYFSVKVLSCCSTAGCDLFWSSSYNMGGTGNPLS